MYGDGTKHNERAWGVKLLILLIVGYKKRLSGMVGVIAYPSNLFTNN